MSAAGNIQDHSHKASAVPPEEVKNHLPGHPLALFSRPLLDNSFKSGHDGTFRADTVGDSRGPWTINIEDDNCFGAPCTTRLHARLSIRKGVDLKPMADTDVVAPIDFPLSSLFRQITVQVGNTTIPDLGIGENYGYRRYIDALLGSGPQTSTGILEGCFGAAMDTPGKYEEVVVAEDGNTGFNKRQKLFEKSKDVWLSEDLLIPFTSIQRATPPNMKVRLVFYKQKGDFYLMAGGTEKNYQVVVKDLQITMRRLKVADDIEDYQRGKIRKLNEFLLPFQRCDMRERSFAKGENKLDFSNMFVGNSLPSLILAVCVHSDAFGGRMSMNPYNFQHFDMDRVWLALNAESIPAEHYELDLDPGAGKNPHANKMFMDLYDTWLRHARHDGSTMMTYERFRKGSFIMAFDTSIDKSIGVLEHTKHSGSISLKMTFKKPLEQNVTVIVMGLSSDEILVDQFSNVRVKSHLTKVERDMGH